MHESFGFSLAREFYSSSKLFTLTRKRFDAGVTYPGNIWRYIASAAYKRWREIK